MAVQLYSLQHETVSIGEQAGGARLMLSLPRTISSLHTIGNIYLFKLEACKCRYSEFLFSTMYS